MKVIDTNVILRYLLADHESHFLEAQALMMAVMEGKLRLLVIDSVIAECVYVLLKFYEIPKQEVANQLLGLLAYKGINGSNLPAIKEALRIFSTSKISFVDALVVTTARTNQCSIASFDKALNK